MGLGAAKWQAQKWPDSTSRNSGRSWEHFSHAMGQRVWKQQPEGASMGDGGSPARTMRLRVAWMSGSGTGTAEPKWIAGRPTEPGVYLTKFHPLDDDLVLADIQTVYADGSFSLGDVDVVAWYPIPPEV